MALCRWVFVLKIVPKIALKNQLYQFFCISWLKKIQEHQWLIINLRFFVCYTCATTQKDYLMRKFFIVAAMSVATLTITTNAADVGVSITVGEPGFFGQLNIGDFPQPSVIYTKPVVIDRDISENQSPTYLHVPPRHYKNWNKYCHEYNACGKKVYFVNDNWYQNEYVPRYHDKQENRSDEQENHRSNKHNKEHGNKGHGDRD